MRVDSFKGMNNVTTKTRDLDEPDIILNAHVTADGSLEKRDGAEKIIDLPGSHSLWTDGADTILCMAEGILYRLRNNVAEVIIDTGQPDAAVNYLVISGYIYISNAYYTGMYNPVTNSIMSWGSPLPDAPVIVPCAGGFDAGTYHVCFTVLGTEGRSSGNGALSSIILSDGGGMKISNLPAGGSIWITDPNGSQLYYAGNSSIITTTFDSSEPLPTMWGSPPLPMFPLCYAHGRVFGGNKKKVYYSEPFQPELFRLTDAFFEIGETISMIAKTPGGLYVGSNKSVYFFEGKNPVEMIQHRVGDGVVSGSLCYASSLSKFGRNVPIWLGSGGIFAGTPDGQVVNLVKERVVVDPVMDKGASIHRVKDGQTKMLFAYKSRDISMGDQATCEIIRNGTVIQSP